MQISAICGPPGAGKSDLALQLVALFLLANPDSRVLMTSKGNATLEMFTVRLSSLLPADAELRPQAAWVPAASSTTMADPIVLTTLPIHEKVKAMQSLRFVLATTGVLMNTMRTWHVAGVVQTYDLLIFDEAQCGPDPADPLVLALLKHGGHVVLLGDPYQTSCYTPNLLHNKYQELASRLLPGALRSPVALENGHGVAGDHVTDRCRVALGRLLL